MIVAAPRSTSSPASARRSACRRAGPRGAGATGRAEDQEHPACLERERQRRAGAGRRRLVRRRPSCRRRRTGSRSASRGRAPRRRCRRGRGPLDAALGPGGAEVGLRRADAGVGEPRPCSGLAIPPRPLLPGLGEQRADRLLGLVVVALAEVDVAEVAVGVDQVLGRPVLVAERVPGARSRCPGRPGSGSRRARSRRRRCRRPSRTRTRASARRRPSGRPCGTCCPTTSR